VTFLCVFKSVLYLGCFLMFLFLEEIKEIYETKSKVWRLSKKRKRKK
jgi:hypothetical protein